MSMVLTQSPLVSIGMNGGGPQKRRSARLSQETSAENEPPVKKAKVNSSSTTTAVSTKQQDGDNSKASGKRKRKVYDEDVEEFTFTRGGRGKGNDSKKASARDVVPPATVPKAAVSAEPPEATAPTNLQPEPPADDAAPKTTQKKTRRRLPTTPDRDVAEKPARRSKRLSNEKSSETDAKQAPGHSPQRPSHAQSHMNTNHDRSPSPEKARPVTVEKKRKHGAHGVEEEKVMMIALPFADTPIIRRNKEMRKTSADGHRRSSAGMRGKRASSLIDEGRGHEVSKGSPTSQVSIESARGDGELCEQHAAFSRHSEALSLFEGAYSAVSTVLADKHVFYPALPHSEVPAFEFFKHISAELTEPRRMRCLLGWCGTRSLPQKPDPPEENNSAASIEFQASQAARIIQEELSQDLVTKGTLSDWFSRDDSTAPPIPLRKKANPRNLTNAAKAEELERELERLRTERAEWDEVVRSAVSQRPSGDEAQTPLSPVRPEALDSPQRTIYEQLQPLSGDAITDAGTIQQRLKSLSDDLEFAVDQFAHGVHALSTTRQTAERVAEKSLAEAANTLGEREKQRVAHGKPVDQMDALRGLARVLNAQHK